MTVVLTNIDDFSAHIVSTVTSSSAPPLTTTGELLGREGRLVFQPTLPLKGKHAQREGGLFFIWDDTRNSGYVLSDALQGYAPIRSDTDTAGQLDISKSDVQDNIEGHPCHRCDAIVSLSNGIQKRFTLWQADDEKHFPVRIEGDDGPNHTRVDFTEIRLEDPGQELFAPPDGFTPYESSVALMNELIVRESNLNRKHEFSEDEPSPNKIDWSHTSGVPTQSTP
jgi:hypothetical protein